MTTPENQALAEVKAALQDSEVRIRLVHTFTHGRGVQVYLKTRKVGPLILPSEGENVSHVLAMLGSLAVQP